MLTMTEVYEQVTAKIEVKLRSLPDESGQELFLLENGDVALRTATSANGWSRLEYQGTVCYAVTNYLTTDLDYDPATAPAPEPVDSDGDGLLTEFTPVDETVTAKEETNLRTLPSTEHPDCKVIYLLKHGETVRRTGIDERWGWSRLEYMGEVCYAITNYLTTDIGENAKDLSQIPQVEVTMPFNDTNETVTARIKVNLRNIPSTEDENSRVVYELVNGDTATLTGIAKTGEWCRVEYKGETLYCIYNYLEKVN